MSITKGLVYHIHLERATLNGQRAYVVTMGGYQLAVIWDPEDPEYGGNTVCPLWLAAAVWEAQATNVRERGGLPCGCQSDDESDWTDQDERNAGERAP